MDTSPSTNPAATGVEAPYIGPARQLPPAPPVLRPRKPRTPRAAWAADTRAGLALAAGRLREILERIVARNDPEADGSELTHLVQSLVRLKEAAIKEEEHRAEQAAAVDKWREAHLKPAPDQGLTPEVLQQIEHELNLF